MSAVFMVYDTFGDLDLAQPNNTYAQVVNDPVQGNNRNYIKVGAVGAGHWSPVADPISGTTIPDLFMEGATPTLVTAAIKAGEVHLIAHGYCLADGVTTIDESLAITAIAQKLASLGGGKIIFDRPPQGGFYHLKTPILLQNKVTYEGVDSSVLIHNTSSPSNQAACFHGNGIAQQNYPYYGVAASTCPLNAISAGDHTVTCSTSNGGAAFDVDSVILIFSTDGESPPGTVVASIPTPTVLPAPPATFLPFFSRQYRVVAKTGTPHTDTLHLDYAIAVAVPHPVVCNGTGGSYAQFDTHLIDRVVIRNLRVSSDDTTNGNFIDSGMYDSVIENIWVDNARSLITANGLARTEVNGIRGFFSWRAMELATGSHDCHVRHLRGAWNGVGTFTSFVLADEYSANIELSDFNFFAPDASPSNAAFNVGQTSGLRIHDGYVRFNGTGIGMTNQPASSSSDNEFRNVVLNLSGQISNLHAYNVSGYSFTATNFRMRNVQFTGATPSTAACWFEVNCDINFDDVDFGTGKIKLTSGVAITGRMSRVRLTEWSGSFTDIGRIDKKGMIRASGQGAYSAAQYLYNMASTVTASAVTGIAGTAVTNSAAITMASTTNIAIGDIVTVTGGSGTIPGWAQVKSVDSSTQVTMTAVATTGGSPTLTFTHNVAAFLLPPGLVVTPGDQIILEALGTVACTASQTVLIAIADNTGAILTVTVPLSASGAFNVRAVATMESDSLISVMASITFPTAATGYATSTGTGEVRRTSPPSILSNGRNLILQAWLGGALAAITFNSISTYAKLYGE